MAPTKHFEYLVIGGGSGGVASARRAASYGAKTLLIEGKHLGGTCVNVGCVPKKVMWNASDMAIRINHQAKGYEFDVNHAKFDWPAFKVKRDAYIERLRGIYASNLKKENVDFVFGWAKFVDAHTVHVKLNDGGEETYTADNILVATGGSPSIPKDIPGAELGITSDGFFELETQPEKVALVGAGYISVELSGAFNGLGTETHTFIRGDKVLRKFDTLIQDVITETYEKHGVHLHKKSAVTKIEKGTTRKLAVTYTEDGSEHTIEVDVLIWAIGRHPLSYDLNVVDAGVKLDDRGKVEVNKYQETSVKGIFSVGDLAEDVELTPAAIAAGRKLSDRLFGGVKDAHLDYNDIPSAVFSHPEAGSIGLTEKQAREKFDNVKVYQSKFINMYYAVLPQEDKEPTAYKIVCAGDDEKVVGLHLVGDASSEILQGFGVAVKMGATKKDFDSCVAIHPTAAEELVTMR